MKQMIALAVFTLTLMGYTLAQQPSSGQGTSPNSQTPGGSQSQTQPPAPGSQDPSQTPAPSGDNGPAANQPITEGCLGGANPNYTLTDKSGTTYKLSFPSTANVASLEPHVGESVQVMGPINASTINVSRIGKGKGTCPAKAPKQQ
jgi:hypothetical protein